MRSFAAGLVVTSLAVHHSLAFNCTIPPIYIDIHKRVVHGTDTFQYGAFTGIGTPGQNQSLWPSLSQNETSVADLNFCRHSTLQNCERSTRGNFDLSESPTFLKDDQHQPVDSDSIVTDSYFGKDTFYLYTHYFESDPASQTVLSKFPIQVATNASTSPGILGLGQTSSLLRQLFNAGMIAGRTFGLYVGTGSDRAGGVINGSISLGGYDAGRFVGEVHNYSMDTTAANALKVRVTDLVIDEPGGTRRNVSLFDGAKFPGTSSSPFDAVLSTDTYPLHLPAQLTSNIASLVGAEEDAGQGGDSLVVYTPFNGTLTIHLSTGFSITLPPSTLLNNTLTPIAARAQNSTMPFTLGTAFLSQVYLMANYDTYVFHLAQVVQSAPYILPTTFCPKSVPRAYVPSKGDFWSKGLVGAVVGGVVGGMALVTFAICFGLVWWRRRQSRRAEGEWEIEMEGKEKVVAFQDVEEEKKPKDKFWRRG